MPAFTKKKPSKQPTASAQRTVDVIAAELVVEREKLSKLYNTHKDYDLISARIDILAIELDTAEATATPIANSGLPRPTDRDVAIASIVITSNHREIAHEADTVRLSRSLLDVGLQQRIGLRNLGDGKAELIFGSRRLAAAKLAGWTEISAKVYPVDTTADQVEFLRLIENVQRAELTPAERALAVARFMDTLSDPSAEALKRIDAAGGKNAYVGQLLGRSAAWVRDHSYVNRLGGIARQLLSAGKIDLGHARELAKLADPADTDRLAKEAARNEQGTGGREVAWVQKRVAETMHSLRGMPWRLDVVFGKFDRACENCPHNSKSDPSLFEHDTADTQGALMAKAGTCLDSACFDDKKEQSEKFMQVGVKAAVKMIDVQDEVPVTATTLAPLTPDAIRPDSFARQVKKAIDPATPAAKKTDTPKVDHIYEAKKAWAEQTRKWGAKIAGELLKKMKKKPGALLVLHLLSSTLTLRKISVPGYCAYGHDQDSAEKEFQKDFLSRAKFASQTANARILGYLRDPSFKNLCKLEQDMAKVLTGEDDFGDLMPDALVSLAKLFDVEVDDAPDRDAMIEAARSKA